MPIFSSKKAITRSAVSQESIDLNKLKEGPFLSYLFNSDIYLVSLVLNRHGVKNLSIDNNNNNNPAESIRRIRIALNIADSAFDGFTLPGKLNPNILSFDQALKDSIENFQNFAGLPVNGIVDATTVKRLDYYISDSVILDEAEKFVGFDSKKRINIESQQDAEGNYIYSIDFDGEIITFGVANILEAQIITPNDETETQNKILLSNSKLKESAINGAMPPLIDEQIEKINTTSFPILENVTELSLPSQSGENITNNSIKNEESKTPKPVLSETQAILVYIEGGEDILDIIRNEYYTEEHTIFSTIDDQPVYTFPSRAFPPQSEWSDDPRLQYYLNLIYYFNTEEDENGNVTTYGVKDANGYQRYEEQHLNNFYMFANELDPSNTNSQSNGILSNYYYFLKNQESLNPNSKIQFTQDMVTSFQPDGGKYIYLPTKEYADSLFYKINFRPKEMITSGGDYITESEVPVIFRENDPSFWDDVTSWVKDTTIELYKEVVTFYSSIYDYLIDLLDEIPRGIGGRLGGGIGITWGIPLATDIGVRTSLWRKMTKNSELTLSLRQEIEIFIGFDTGIGVGFNLGLGSKKKPLSIGAGAVANFEAGHRPSLILEYEFPLHKEETGAMLVLLSLFGGKTKLAASAIGMLNGINMSPLQYLTWCKLSYKQSLRGTAVATLGVPQGGTLDKDKGYKKIRKNTPTSIEARDNAGFDFDNIIDKIPGIGAQAIGDFAIGQEIEYHAKYDNKPLIPAINARVPSEADVNISYFIEAGLDAQGSGGGGNNIKTLLQQFLINTSLNLLLSFLNFEKGFQLGLVSKFRRNVAASELDTTQLDFSALNPNNFSIGEQGGNLLLEHNTIPITMELGLRAGAYTGDVDRFFVKGSEQFIHINTHTLWQIGNGTINWQDISTVLGLLHKIELNYKTGLGYDGGKKLRVTDEVLNTGSNGFGDVKSFLVQGVSSKLIKRQNARALDLWAGVQAGLSFTIQPLLQSRLLHYFFKRSFIVLHYKAIISDTQDLKGVLGDLNRTIQTYKDEFSIQHPNLEINTIQYYIALYQEVEAQLSTNAEYAAILNNADFLNVLKNTFSLTTVFLNYLLDDTRNILLSKPDSEGPLGEIQNLWQDFAVEELLKALCFLTPVQDKLFAFELKAGVQLAAGAQGAFGAKVRATLFGEGSFIDRSQLIYDNEFITIENDDPSAATLARLKKIGEDPQRLDGIIQYIIPSTI